ncbi:MAG: D-threonine aldolase [Chitinophagaceae bacterium]|nr:D-threonine aldolase [Chitinophagaceae bacterium]
MKENNEDAWYVVSNIDEADSPALVIYLSRVKRNIELLKGMVDDIQRLRPHVKTHKSREAALLLMEAGIQKFKCATIAEADMLAECNALDVLLAYQPVGPKIKRLISLIENYPSTKFSCLVDDESAAHHIAQAAVNAGITIPVYVDVNVGMNRTGIAVDKVIDLYIDCSQTEGIFPVGLHVYDGHITDPDFQIRTQKCNEAFKAIEQLEQEIIAKGFTPVIVAGGSPTFPVHAKRKKIECSPGTFIYWDAGYQQNLAEQPFLPAALIISRIISRPSEFIICSDLGHKSVASENDLINRVRFLNAPELVPVGQSEEHLKLQTGKTYPYQVGDVLYGMPFHICPTCALYERALIVEDGKISGEWKTIARDRKINA